MLNLSDKKAFTMPELLLALAVIAALAAIIVPSLGLVKPNKSKSMYKKTYQEMSRIISEIVNDNKLYYEATGVVGFDNVKKVTINSHQYEGKTKFCELFASKMNTIESEAQISANCVNAKDGAVGQVDFTGTASFTTTDGVTWYLPRTNFTDSTGKNPAWKTIAVDVNGPKGPNMENSSATGCNRKADRFLFYVSADGVILPSNEDYCSTEYLKDMGLHDSDRTGTVTVTSASVSLGVDGDDHEPGSDENNGKFFDQSGTGDYDPSGDEDIDEIDDETDADVVEE